MPRKKSEFKPLTEKEIIKNNPQRKYLVGAKNTFKTLITEGTKHAPFDKRKS